MDSLLKKRGRPPFKPTGEQRDQVIAMSSNGVPHRQQAPLIGCSSPKTLRKHFREELNIGSFTTECKDTYGKYRKKINVKIIQLETNAFSLLDQFSIDIQQAAQDEHATVEAALKSDFTKTREQLEANLRTAKHQFAKQFSQNEMTNDVNQQIRDNVQQGIKHAMAKAIDQKLQEMNQGGMAV